VVALLKPEWGLSTSHISWLNSITLLASAAGALVFGRVADILGRKKIYGCEVLILAIGALASAFAPNYTFLLICRAVLGVGIGGDHPVSATIMSEYSGKQSRGRMVGLVFAMQGAGLIVGPLVASILLGSGISDDYVWRILLALGAIPGLAVFYLRRQIHETPRFAMAGGAADEAEAAIAAAAGAKSPEHDHLHLSGRDLPAGGPDDRARHLGGRGEDGRVRGRLPVPGHAGLVHGRPRC
jgi:PHS family inorganic phosphate transporter-like MFS transporter